MDKLKFMKRAFALITVLSAIVLFIVGVNSPIEAGMSVFGHWLKTFFMWCWVLMSVWVFTYVLGQIAFHWVDDYKDKYGKRWFIEGIKDDFHYIKEQVTWKKVLKYVGIYIVFFAVCLIFIGVIEYFVP